MPETDPQEAFQQFNRTVLEICDEVDDEAQAPVTSSRFPPIPILQDNRASDRHNRFEVAAERVYAAALELGIPREEAELKIKKLSASLSKLIYERWWQRFNVESKAENEQGVVVAEFKTLWNECHEARQDVYRLRVSPPLSAKRRESKMSDLSDLQIGYVRKGLGDFSVIFSGDGDSLGEFKRLGGILQGIGIADDVRQICPNGPAAGWTAIRKIGDRARSSLRWAVDLADGEHLWVRIRCELSLGRPVDLAEKQRAAQLSVWPQMQLGDMWRNWPHVDDETKKQFLEELSAVIRELIGDRTATKADPVSSTSPLRFNGAAQIPLDHLAEHKARHEQKRLHEAEGESVERLWKEHSDAWTHVVDHTRHPSDDPEEWAQRGSEHILILWRWLERSSTSKWPFTKRIRTFEPIGNDEKTTVDLFRLAEQGKPDEIKHRLAEYARVDGGAGLLISAWSEMKRFSWDGERRREQQSAPLTAPHVPERTDPVVPRVPGSKKKATVNERMAAIFLKDPNSCFEWTAEEWADRLKCRSGTVKGTPTWTKIMDFRRIRQLDKARPDKKPDRRRVGRKRSSDD